MQNAAETYLNRAARKSSLLFWNRFVRVAICTVYFLSIWRSWKRLNSASGKIALFYVQNSLIITLSQIKWWVLIFLKQSDLCKILQFISLPFEFFNFSTSQRWGKAPSDLSTADFIMFFGSKKSHSRRTNDRPAKPTWIEVSICGNVTCLCDGSQLRLLASHNWT